MLIVDDGLAMGSTMGASVSLCRKRNAGIIVVAVPVAGGRTAAEMGELADAIPVIETPSNFRAVARVYRYWYDVSDREVLRLMESWNDYQS